MKRNHEQIKTTEKKCEQSRNETAKSEIEGLERIGIGFKGNLSTLKKFDRSEKNQSYLKKV